MSGRERVLHLIDSMSLGGAQRVLRSLLAAFRHPRYELEVAVLHGPGVATERFLSEGLAPYHLAKTKHDPFLPFKLRRHIQRGRYTIVHAHLVPSGFLCETFRGYLGIKRLVCHVHNLYGFHERHRYQNLLEWCMYRRADRVIACSQSVLDSIPRAVPGTVIHNGLDEAALQHLAAVPTRGEARRMTGMSEEAFVVGTAGRISAAKNHALLCRLVAELRDDLPHLRAVIVGAGPKEGAVRRLATRLGVADRVEFAGYHADVAPYLAAMDVFAMTSHGEGLPMALIEAMAAGKACVAPDSPWAREAVSSEKTGIFFAPDSVADLAAQIRRLARSPVLRAMLGENAQYEAQTRFGMGQMAERLAVVYDELMETIP